MLQMQGKQNLMLLPRGEIFNNFMLEVKSKNNLREINYIYTAWPEAKYEQSPDIFILFATDFTNKIYPTGRFVKSSINILMLSCTISSFHEVNNHLSPICQKE